MIHTFKEHPLSHTEKKILEHIESDRPLYSGAHVAKIPPATPPMMPPFAMGPMGPMGAQPHADPGVLSDLMKAITDQKAKHQAQEEAAKKSQSEIKKPETGHSGPAAT